MIGPILTAGFGALTFKLGIEAQKLYAKGYTTCEVVRKLACGTVELCKEAAKTVCPCCFGEVEGEDEEEEPAAKPTRKARPSKSSKSGKSGKTAKGDKQKTVAPKSVPKPASKPVSKPDAGQDKPQQKPEEKQESKSDTTK